MTVAAVLLKLVLVLVGTALVFYAILELEKTERRHK